MCCCCCAARASAALDRIAGTTSMPMSRTRTCSVATLFRSAECVDCSCCNCFAAVAAAAAAAAASAAWAVSADDAPQDAVEDSHDFCELVRRWLGEGCSCRTDTHNAHAHNKVLLLHRQRGTGLVIAPRV